MPMKVMTMELIIVIKIIGKINNNSNNNLNNYNRRNMEKLVKNMKKLIAIKVILQHKKINKLIAALNKK